MNTCLNCAKKIEAPATTCSQACYDAVYGGLSTERHGENRRSESDPMEDYTGDGETEAE